MTATVGGWVWVDGLTEAQRVNLRRDLTVYPRKTTDIASVPTPDPIALFRERSDGTFGVPRGYWQRTRTGRHAEVLALADPVPMRPLTSRWRADPPFQEQAVIVETLQRLIGQNPYWGGILQAGCGTGKSEIGIELAHRLGRKTIIFVHQEFLQRQWRDRILKLLPGARVGIIQQDRCEWEDVDFSIAILQSLMNDRGDKYPTAMYGAFHMAIFDEVHHMPAECFAPIIPRFNAPVRLGLSATWRRKDESETVFLEHIGPVVYQATSQSMVPQLRVLRTAAQLAPIHRGWDRERKRWKYEVSIEKLNSAQILTQLADQQARNAMIAQEAVEAVRHGRKILILSERLEQLRDLEGRIQRMCAGVSIGHYTGQWFTAVPGKMRAMGKADLDRAARCQVILATKQLCKEGMDIPALDVLLLATPTGDVEQVVGRVRRWCLPEAEKCAHMCAWRAGTCKGKPVPIVVDVIDPLIGRAVGRWRTRVRQYREMGMQIPEL